MAHLNDFGVLTIANMALSHIGARAIMNSIEEDSPEAQQVRLWYESCRAQTLQAYNWNFARKRIQGSKSTSPAPEFDWEFRYVYPPDALSIRQIENPFGHQADAIPFSIESDGQTKSIVTNLDNARIIYTYDLTDTSQFSPLFSEILSINLASKIAFTLTGRAELKQALSEQYRFQLLVASAHDGNEQIGKQPRESEFIRTRGGGFDIRDFR